MLHDGRSHSIIHPAELRLKPDLFVKFISHYDGANKSSFRYVKLIAKMTACDKCIKSGMPVDYYIIYIYINILLNINLQFVV